MGKVYGERWEVVSSLGEGGQAHTFIVRDLQTNDSATFVLKRLKNPSRLGRFVLEVKALKLVGSDRVPDVLDYRTDEPAYVVTEQCLKPVDGSREACPPELSD